MFNGIDCITSGSQIVTNEDVAPFDHYCCDSGWTKNKCSGDRGGNSYKDIESYFVYINAQHSNSSCGQSTITFDSEFSVEDIQISNISNGQVCKYSLTNVGGNEINLKLNSLVGFEYAIFQTFDNIEINSGLTVGADWTKILSDSLSFYIRATSSTNSI